MTLLYEHPLSLKHDPGAGHPERAERLEAIAAAIAASPLPGLTRRQPAEATIAQLQRVHAAAYVERLLDLRGKRARLDPETTTSEATIDAALHGAGAACQAVDALMAGEDTRAFALTRPPGHHAEHATAMGFCFFNNVAIAAAHAVEAYGLSRVMILDWDVHHGNGTQRAFYDRADVLTIDLHEDGLWPEQSGLLEEVGQGAGEGFMVNVPMRRGQGDAAYLAAFEQIIEPIAAQYAPELVLISAGFDAHMRDPLAHMMLSAGGYAAMAERVVRLAEASAGGRVLFLLEGGYDLEGVSQSVRACLDVLCGQRDRWGAPGEPGAPAMNVEAARAYHARWWPLLVSDVGGA